MEQTFMTIHNLSPDATILFASESIADILGYPPAEVQGKSCFDYFHPAEVPFARSVHSRGVLLDKAAVLHYCRILSRDGRWIGCECCFTIVHDVLVACTSIYRRGAKSERRAIEAPQIRRIFACSPRDPRYHMLEHLSPKFKMSPVEREPRTALILNRFTRNLTVMFATNAISSIIGLEPHQIKNKSFYKCIQESCLPEAIRCLESAKENDSIAYLRFFFRDPREDDEFDDGADDGGDDIVDLTRDPQRDPVDAVGAVGTVDVDMDVDMDGINAGALVKMEEDAKTTSAPGLRPTLEAADVVTASAEDNTTRRARRSARLPSIELEAVVSCTSDGLVVILRKARPPIPPAHPPLISYDYGNGIFAAPWSQQPIPPRTSAVESHYAFRPPLLPQYMPPREPVKDAGGPPLDVLMGSIRDVAVFAWGLVGINPEMAAYGRGLPSGEARPANRGYGSWQQQQRQQPEGSGSEAAVSDATTPSGSPPHWPSSSTGAGLDKGKGPEFPAAAPLLAQRGYASSSLSSSTSALGSAAAAAPGQGSCSFQSSWGTAGGAYVSGASADALQSVPFGFGGGGPGLNYQPYQPHQQPQQQSQQRPAFASEGPTDASRLAGLSSDEPSGPLPVYGVLARQGAPHPSPAHSIPGHLFGWH